MYFKAPSCNTVTFTAIATASLLKMGGRVVVWAVAGCAGAGALLVWWAWRRRYPETPWRWEDVGEVGELVIYPLRGGRGVKVTEAEATRYGLAVEEMEDRSFIATSHYPSMVRPKFDLGDFDVSLTLDGSMVTLRCRWEGEEEEVEFDLQDVIKRGKVVEFSEIFTDDTLKGYDCGDEAAALLTKVTRDKRKRESVRLVYSGDLVRNREPRKVLKLSATDIYTYRLFKPSDRVVYGEDAAYMLASETSLADLNERQVKKKVTLDWFRPNVVVRGVRQAYDEDDWAYVRIGEVVLRRVKPCIQYKFWYLDPETGKNITNEEENVILKTLLRTRKMEGPKELQDYWERNPVFGVHLGIDSCGKVRVGDKVQVARASSNPRWQL
ncbi:mitochondrial amidoxime-reducing component 1-like isoform X2 [Portunus trituberculatus]|uniref:mitochondrial amidoxime-reducing component 1-like isoform X2 n=1 Tax=Portunus trituberculatus TaxID=210409 RepID=UPI001E1CFBE0|nr:mitochondrial amidoxime-reducing component 1-like isoform X2 [Portunus trituberculatus]